LRDLHFKGTDVASHSKNAVAKYEFIKRFYDSLRLIDDSALNSTTIVVTGDHTRDRGDAYWRTSSHTHHFKGLEE